MGNFNKFDKNRDGGGKRFGGGFGGDRKFGGGAPRQMFQATCSECGQSCEVPFKPTGQRPVFCNNCFRKQGGSAPSFAPKSFGGGNQGGGHSAPPAGGVPKAQFDVLSAKVDKILALLTTTKVEATSKVVASEVPEKKEVVKKAKASAKKAKSKKK